MSESRYDEILSKAYSDYVSNFIGYDDVPSIFWFAENAKKDPSFIQRWKIKITEQRILLSERVTMASKHPNFSPLDFGMGDESHEFAQKVCDDYDVPKIKLVIEYKGKIAEKYESTGRNT